MEDTMPEHVIMALKGTEDIETITCAANDQTPGCVMQMRDFDDEGNAGFVRRVGANQEEAEAANWCLNRMDDEKGVRMYTRYDNIKNNLAPETGLDPD